MSSVPTPGWGAERPVFGVRTDVEAQASVSRFISTRAETMGLRVRLPGRDRTEPDKPRASLHMSKAFRRTYAYRARALELDAIAIAIGCWRCSRRSRSLSPRVCGSCTEFGGTGLLKSDGADTAPPLERSRETLQDADVDLDPWGNLSYGTELRLCAARAVRSRSSVPPEP